MRLFFAIVLSLLVAGLAVAAENGLITKKSSNNTKQTIDKLEAALKKKGMTIFARVNHTDGATRAKIKLRKTELLIFGNPKMGSHFFTSKQTAGIDLPMKALAWEDDKGQVWLTYNDPSYIAKRHGIADRTKIVSKMTNALDKFTNVATKK